MAIKSNRSPILRVLGLGALLIALSGCATHPADKTPSSTVVAVLINRSWTELDPRGFTWEVHGDEQAEEERFATCVNQAAASMGLPLQATTGSRFRALAFPDLDAKSAPRHIETLRTLIPDPRFQARIDAAGIRYVAIVGGTTRTSETKGWVGCAGGYGGGGCFGFLWWDHESQLSALIIDLHSGAELAKNDIDATGKSWFSILAILPLAAPSTHEAKGCARFGSAVAETIGAMRHEGK